MSDFSEEDIKEFIKFKKLMEKENAGSNKEESIASVDTSDDLLKLEQRFSTFLGKPQNFDVGDIVRWKKGLKNKKYPKEGQLCMVVEELEQPIVQDTRDSGSPYYREPLDLVLALLDDDSDFVIFHYDKRRFELVKKAKKE